MEKFAYLIYEPKKSAEKRKLLKEAQKIQNIFNPIEESFIIELFTTDKSYNESYIKYLNIFKKNCDWIKKENKFLMFKINDKYFSNQYKPIENIN